MAVIDLFMMAQEVFIIGEVLEFLSQHVVKLTLNIITTRDTMSGWRSTTLLNDSYKSWPMHWFEEFERFLPEFCD